MPFLVSLILLYVVQVVSSDNNCPLHLCRFNSPCQDPPSYGHISSEGALVVNICPFNCLLWGFEPQTNVLVVSKSLLAWDLPTLCSLFAKPESHVELLLKSPLCLLGHDGFYWSLL